MLVESSSDSDDDFPVASWPLTMSEDLIVSNSKGLVEPQSLNISGLYSPSKRTIQKVLFLASCICVFLLCYLHCFVLYSIDAQHCPPSSIAYEKQK